jgi:hypothetical protein
MKITLEGAKAKIKGETYLVLPDARTTLCQLTLENGFTVTGTGSCIDPASFNIDLGRRYAFDEAMRKVFEVEAYLLMQKNYEHKLWVKHYNEQEEKKVNAAPYGLKKDGTPKQKPGGRSK